jgi:hypothetical protein
MRAFFEAVEQRLSLVRTADLEAALSRDEMAALRRAGWLRGARDDGIAEISFHDLVRGLRALYGIDDRGLSIPPPGHPEPVRLGSSGEGDSRRDVILAVWATREIHFVHLHRRRTLVLLPTARALTPELRAKYGPGAFIAVEALDESLRVVGGRIARAAAVTPDAPEVPSPAPVPAPASPAIPGATRWNLVRIAVLDGTTVRIDVAGRTYRRTHVDLGMAHARNREPTRVWELLQAFCEGHGTFEGWRFGKADATKKLVSRLRRDLHALFGLEESPFHPYRKGEGWRAKFQAAPR